MKELELDIAIKNLQTFSSIKKYDRMIVNNNNYYVQIDNRYGQSLRRWYTNDSREDLIKPIKLTYNKALKEYKNGNLSYKTILDSLNNLFNVCVFTYQDFDKLHKLIMDLRSKLELVSQKKNCINEQINVSLDNTDNEYDIETAEEIPNNFWFNIWNNCKSIVYNYVIKPIKNLFNK